MRALVLNDTRRGSHLGCILVMRQLIEGCRTSGIQVTRALSLGRRFKEALRNEISRCDIVIINGEGTMHHDTPGALALTDAGLLARDNGKPLALINTVWEGNNRANELLPCASLIYARESMSAAEIGRLGAAVSIVPDLALSCPANELFPRSGPAAGQGPVLVLDDVRFDLAMLLARYARERGLDFFRMASRPSLRSIGAAIEWGQLFVAGGGKKQLLVGQVSKIREASVVVTGRFHGACLAILAKRPFVAVSSNTHKIEGLLADAHLGEGAVLITDAELCRNPFEQIDEAVLRVGQATRNPGSMRSYHESCETYAEKARRGSAMMFRSILALGREHSGG